MSRWPSPPTKIGPEDKRETTVSIPDNAQLGVYYSQISNLMHRFQTCTSCWRTIFQSNRDDRQRVWIDLQSLESKMLLARFVSAGSVYIGRVQVTTVSVKITSNFSNHLWCQKDSNVNVTECCLLKCCDPQFLPFDTQIFWQRVTWKFYGEQ